MFLKREVLFSKIFIVLLSLCYFIPNFYSIDRIGNQWIYLGIVNFFGFIFISLTGFDYKDLIKTKNLKYFLLFVTWSFISIIYSFNKAESLITSNQYFTIFTSLLLSIFLLKKLPKNKEFILSLLFILLLFEVFLSGYPILKDLNSNNLIFRSMTYSGAAANINITAFSILYKLPIVLYFHAKSKKLISKIIYTFLIILIVLIIGVLGTRGAFLGLASILFFHLIFLFVNQNFKKQRVNNLFLFIVGISLSIIINFSILDKQENILSRASTISVSTKDGSVNQRLRYYSQALNHIKENFFLGIGSGNWKIVSIDYDKKDIEAFVIPYHAHNDFLQIFSELGIFGIIFYILFIVFSFKKLIFNSNAFNDKINIILLSSLTVYIIDSMLNFPIARPISQIFLILLVGLVEMYKIENSEN